MANRSEKIDGVEGKPPKRSETYREKQFVSCFKRNATEAAIAAGYKKSAARFIGSRLLAKPEIRAQLNLNMAEAAKKVAVERIDRSIGFGS